MDLKTYAEHYTEKQQNLHSSQEHMECYNRIDNKLDHKTSLNKFKMKVTSNTLSDCNGMKSEINNRRNIGKFS
jgi:hypothetical protein